MPIDSLFLETVHKLVYRGSRGVLMRFYARRPTKTMLIDITEEADINDRKKLPKTESPVSGQSVTLNVLRRG